MNDDENTLIERLRARLRDPLQFIDVPEAFPHKIYPPVSQVELSAAERQLGFQLPPLLRKLYLCLGNGGFGPGFGLLGLNSLGARNYHMNLVDWYLERVNTTHPDYPPWPKQFITICDWGDGITSELDWTTPDYSIYRFNGDRYEEGSFEDVIRLEALSLKGWLEDWVGGQSLFDRGRL